MWRVNKLCTLFWIFVVHSIYNIASRKILVSNLTDGSLSSSNNGLTIRMYAFSGHETIESAFPLKVFSKYLT